MIFLKEFPPPTEGSPVLSRVSIMSQLRRTAPLPFLLLALPVWAGDLRDLPPAVPQTAVPVRLLETGPLEVGVGQASPEAVVTPKAERLKLGGYVRWNDGQTTLDAQLVSGGGDRFSVNPHYSPALAQSSEGHDRTMTVTLNHAVTPSLSVIGTAEAGRITAQEPRATLLAVGAGVKF